jgi:hypothetical protein
MSAFARSRRERPCRSRAAEQRDELATFHFNHLVGDERGHPLFSASSEARTACPFAAPGFNSPRAVSRTATPAAATAAVAVFFATCLSFDAGVRAAVFFDLDDVLPLVVFLAFGLTIARFDDLGFACLALFFMSSSG